jgi:hypothetical protein
MPGSVPSGVGLEQRSYQRWLHKIIYKTEMKFRAVLGSQGCREKTPNCHKYATFLGGFFNFLWAKIFSRFLEKYFSIRTEKLHRIKTKKILKHFVKHFSLG